MTVLPSTQRENCFLCQLSKQWKFPEFLAAVSLSQWTYAVVWKSYLLLRRTEVKEKEACIPTLREREQSLPRDVKDSDHSGPACRHKTEPWNPTCGSLGLRGIKTERKQERSHNQIVRTGLRAVPHRLCWQTEATLPLSCLFSPLLPPELLTTVQVFKLFLHPCSHLSVSVEFFPSDFSFLLH